MTTLDTIIDRPIGSGTELAAARKLALAAAREKHEAEAWGAYCKVRYDDVVYVVERDGVHRITKSPDGRTLSDRIV